MSSLSRRNPEKKNIIAARRSIFASRKINRDELFTVKNLTVKRPGDGQCASTFFDIVGIKAKQNYMAGEQIIL